MSTGNFGSECQTHTFIHQLFTDSNLFDWQEAELLPCLCVWVLTSVDDVTAGEATSHLVEAPEHHEWTLHDLSIVWRTLLGRGHVRPLLRGFELFQRVKT